MIKWKPAFFPQLLYFITTSAFQHTPIFNDNVTKQIVLDLFDCYRRQEYLELFAFVIMPSHIHFIAKFNNEVPLSDFMRNIKSLPANRIHRYHRAIKKGKHPSKSKIWEDGYIAKEIYSLDFLEQKFDYIHLNPCRGYKKLNKYPEDYPWSSAGYYYTDNPCIIPIDDIREYLMR